MEEGSKGIWKRQIERKKRDWELTQYWAHAECAACYGNHHCHNGYSACGKDIICLAALLCFAKYARPKWSQDGERYKRHKHEVIPAQSTQILGHLAAAVAVPIAAAAAAEDTVSKTEMQKSNTKLVKGKKQQGENALMSLSLSLPLGTSQFIVKTFSSAVEHVHISHAWCHIMPPPLPFLRATATQKLWLHCCISAGVCGQWLRLPHSLPNPHHNPLNKPGQGKSKGVPELRARAKERESERRDSVLAPGQMS